jgi:hypothetical protein
MVILELSIRARINSTFYVYFVETARNRSISYFI